MGGGREEGNSLSWPPRQSMARTKLRWRSAVHLILGSLDRMYCLTAPFLPPPISSIASKVVERTRPEQGCAAGRQVLEERTKLPLLLPTPPGRHLSDQRVGRQGLPHRRAAGGRSLPAEDALRASGHKVRGVSSSSRLHSPPPSKDERGVGL